MWHFTAFSPASLHLRLKDVAVFVVLLGILLPLVEGCGALKVCPGRSNRQGARKSPQSFSAATSRRAAYCAAAVPFRLRPFLMLLHPFISVSLFLDSLIHTVLTFSPSTSSFHLALPPRLPPRHSFSPFLLALLILPSGAAQTSSGKRRRINALNGPSEGPSGAHKAGNKVLR